METLSRTGHVREVRDLIRDNPVVAILGARQVGKTTLARVVAAARRGPVRFFDLEDRDDLAAMPEPKAALAPLSGLVVLDEIQRAPDLFPTLRVLADRPRAPARFLLLGSASPKLLRQSSESLAGRIGFHELGPFALDETGAALPIASGSAAASRGRISLRTTRRARAGGATSPPRSSSATCRSSA